MATAPTETTTAARANPRRDAYARGVRSCGIVPLDAGSTTDAHPDGHAHHNRRVSTRAERHCRTRGIATVKVLRKHAQAAGVHIGGGDDPDVEGYDFIRSNF